MALSHENLDVYQKAMSFLAKSSTISARIPKGYGEMSDQLKRAALSIPLNIAEGCGRTGVGEKSRHFVIARGSAQECGAICDAARILDFLDEPTYLHSKKLLSDIAAMLTKLILK